ncbi:DUF4049 domain-containing protein [Escherichia coli]
MMGLNSLKEARDKNNKIIYSSGSVGFFI